MDLWDEGDDNHAAREWARISESFVNDGYREGITAGKEGALQEGFDDGFARIGVPLGQKVGTLRGIASGLAAFLRNSTQTDVVQEVRAIAQGLDRIQLADIAPPDLEAEEHNRLHGAEDTEVRDPEVDEMDDISSAFQGLGTKDTAKRRDQRRAEASAELQSLERRLSTVLQRLNISIRLDG